jgi:hypothetical protein
MLWGIFSFFYHGATAPSGSRHPRYRESMITLRHTTLDKTPLDEWLARHRDLYLTTHNNHRRHTSIPPAGFKPTIPENERPHTHALDRAATGIGFSFSCVNKNKWQYMVAWIPFWTYLSHCLSETKNICNISRRGKKTSLLYPGHFFYYNWQNISYAAFFSWLESHCTNTNTFLYWMSLYKFIEYRACPSVRLWPNLITASTIG